MPESNLLKRFLDAGLAFTQITQTRAEAIVKDLVSAGEVQTNQAQAAVAELLERSRENTERLFEQVRSDIRAQVENMGLATKADIDRIEQRLTTLQVTTPPPARVPAVPTPPATTTMPARKAAKAPAKKTVDVPAKALAKKAVKAPAKKTPAKAAKVPAKAPAKTAAKKR